MTTEQRPSGRARPSAASDIRLYLTALLATVYMASWWVFGVRTPTAPAVAAVPKHVAKVTMSPPRRVSWYADLPLSERPVVALPAGWQNARTTSQPEPGAIRDAPPRPVRAAPAPRRRIRTRSS